MGSDNDPEIFDDLKSFSNESKMNERKGPNASRMLGRKRRLQEIETEEVIDFIDTTNLSDHLKVVRSKVSAESDLIKNNSTDVTDSSNLASKKVSAGISKNSQ